MNSINVNAIIVPNYLPSGHIREYGDTLKNHLNQMYDNYTGNIRLFNNNLIFSGMIPESR